MKVFTKTFKFEYKTRFLSEATIFYLLISICFRFLVPLCIVWSTDSMWIKESEYHEIASVEFKRKFILIIEGIQNNNNFRQSFTTFSQINDALERSNEYLQVSIEDYEIDTNNDGFMDQLNVTFICHNVPGTIRKVDVLLFFNYRLSSHIDLRMESFIHLSKHYWTSAKQLFVDGTLQLAMRRPFFSSGYDFRYNHSLLTDSGKYLLNDNFNDNYELFNFDELLQRHFDRDYYLQLKEPYLEQWKTLTNNDEKNSFTLNLLIRNEKQSFTYETSFGFLLKWAFIQYTTIFIIIDWIIYKLENAIYCKWFLFPTVRFTNEPIKNVFDYKFQ